MSFLDSPERLAAAKEIRDKNPGCIFPACMCRSKCIVAEGRHPDDGNPFKRIPNPLAAAMELGRDDK